MGQFIKVPGIAPGTDRPKVDLLDPLATNGSLLLIDPTHPVNPWLSGVPAQGTAVPNILGSLAAPLLGADTTFAGATINEVDSTNLITSERTSKGGIHLAVGQSPSSFPSNTFWRAEIATAIKQYILANLNHSYFFSSTFRITRAGLQSSAPVFFSTIAVGGSAYLATVYANQLSAGTQLATYPSTSTGASTFLGARSDSGYAAETNIARLGDVAVSGWQGTSPASAAAIYAHAFQVGRTSPVDAGASAKYPSVVFYRSYLEDLTVSGRSYAQVDSLAYANFQQIFGSGGRYSGDTWTNPASLVA